MTGRPARRGRGLLGAIVLAALAVGAPVTTPAEGPRLLVLDLPYERVWESTLRALASYTLTRAAEGVIETARTERAPLPEETGAALVAERIRVRVEALANRVTRVTVTVEAEVLRGGRWEPLERPSDATLRAVLDRIRAAQS